MGNGLKIKMLIKNWPSLIRCLQGRGPEEEGILIFLILATQFPL